MRWHLGLFAIALALWVGGVVAFFAPNRAALAYWFVWSKLALPVACLVIGSAARAWFSSKSLAERRTILGQHLMYFAVACTGLPILLGGLNHIPLGQRTEHWTGEVTSTQRVAHPGFFGTRIVMSSPELGPRLQFLVDGPVFFQYSDGTVPRAGEGLVVRGFLGLPIACRLTRLDKMFSDDGKGAP